MSLASFFRRRPAPLPSPLDPEKRITASYFICTTHRSGSTLFCEGLMAARCGLPNEYFEASLAAEYAQQWRLAPGADDLTFLRAMLAETASPAGVFGAKLMWHQTRGLRARLRPLVAPTEPRCNLAKLLQRAFPNPRFVWLRRRDTVAQAVSHARALQTGQWHSADAATAAGPAFDFALVEEWVRHFTDWDTQWGEFFARHELKPMEVVYEDFAPRYEATLREALEFIGVKPEPGFAFPPPRLEKLANATNQAWAEQYRAAAKAAG